MSEVDDYLNKVPHQQKAILQHIRELIINTVPNATEVITYGMPGFKYKGKYLIAYAPFKDHMSIFPGSAVIEHLSDQLKGYKMSKGTIQFTAEHPLKDDVLISIIKHRTRDIND